MLLLSEPMNIPNFARPLAPPRFRALLTPGMRLLGLDPGTKTIGVALATFPSGIPTAIMTIRRTKLQLDAATLKDLSQKEKIGGVVIGLPLNMDGSEGPRAQSCRAFAREIGLALALPVMMMDERLSSHAADEDMISSHLSAKRRGEIIDAEAARIILGDALAFLAQNPA
jgi:putative holliday junction resolvase